MNNVAFGTTIPLCEVCDLTRAKGVPLEYHNEIESLIQEERETWRKYNLIFKAKRQAGSNEKDGLLQWITEARSNCLISGVKLSRQPSDKSIFLKTNVSVVLSNLLVRTFNIQQIYWTSTMFNRGRRLHTAESENIAFLNHSFTSTSVQFRL